MFNKKSVFVPAAVAFFSLLIVSGGILLTRGVSAANPQHPEPGASAANAQNPESSCPYTLASLQGHYTIIATYGANVALALGERYFDGNGSLTGTFLLNGPTVGSTTGARTIVTGTQVGTYAVNCDGSGKITRTLTASNGTVVNQVDDFIITGAIKSWSNGEIFLATHLADATEVPSSLVAGGVFVTRTYTRLPDEKPNM